MLPQISQGRRAIWAAVNPHTGKRRIDEAFPQAIRASTNENEMFIRFKNGSTWTVTGSDAYDSLVGSPPAGIVFSEWSRANPSAWAYLAPILVENNGWSLFITTPLGNNHAKSMYTMGRNDPSWFAEVSTVADTQAIPFDAVEAQRKEYHALFGDVAGDYGGRGVPQDYAQARHWYLRASNQGDPMAQYNLAYMYANGQGVPQDYIIAHMWFNLAAAAGEKGAAKNRDITAMQMTPAQIAEAQKLAREFVPKRERLPPTQ
jgi:hypothetical protein